MQIPEDTVASNHRRLECRIARIDSLPSLEEEDVRARTVIRIERSDGNAARVRNHERNLIRYRVLRVRLSLSGQLTTQCRSTPSLSTIKFAVVSEQYIGPCLQAFDRAV